MKVQVPGPVTVATALVHADVPIARAVEVAVRFSTERARAMVEAVADVATTAVPVVVLDEPGLVTLTDDRAVMTVNEAIDLDADAPDIPAGGDHADAPTVTLRDIKRVVTLKFGGVDGSVQRYTDLDAALAGDPPDAAVLTTGGEATFKGVDTDEPAGYVFVPGGGG